MKRTSRWLLLLAPLGLGACLTQPRFFSPPVDPCPNCDLVVQSGNVYDLEVNLDPGLPDGDCMTEVVLDITFDMKHSVHQYPLSPERCKGDQFKLPGIDHHGKKLTDPGAITLTFTDNASNTRLSAVDEIFN